ncbi:hypothetical protein [Lachnotalea glycerini]|nr:hypothetical protein [Lachnotalea glycerini]
MTMISDATLDLETAILAIMGKRLNDNKGPNNHASIVTTYE